MARVCEHSMHVYIFLFFRRGNNVVREEYAETLQLSYTPSGGRKRQDSPGQDTSEWLVQAVWPQVHVSWHARRSLHGRERRLWYCLGCVKGCWLINQVPRHCDTHDCIPASPASSPAAPPFIILPSSCPFASCTGVFS